MLGFLNRFVDSNDRELKRIQPVVDDANGLEPEIAALSDDEIRARFADLRAEIREVAEPDEPSEDELDHPDAERRRELAKERRTKENERIQDALDDVLPEVFAMAREAMRRTLGMRHFDVQLIGGAVLHQGKIAEMQTGEGKTLVAPLAAILNALTGRGVHVVTVNDYLARRDPQWMGPIFHFLGVSARDHHPRHDATSSSRATRRPTSASSTCARSSGAEAYAADVTYGTNNEFGFDYLRDNMVIELDQRVQRDHSFAIVDEVDNILIDEARTPLIISGQAEESADKYFTFARLVPRLVGRPEGAEEGGDYFVDLKDRAVSPTEEGIAKMEKWLGVENLYDADPVLARHFEQALKAHALYKRDRDYIVKDGEIVIVDEFTGRQMPGRRWSEGLHQAVEAKEGLRVQRESVTLATITFQNYFRLYDKLAGMTGTAMTEARGVPQDLQARGRRDPDPPADGPRRRGRPRLPQRVRQVRGPDRRDRRDAARQAGRSSSAPSRSRSRRSSRELLQAARDQARGPQRQVPREGGGDRRPGRAGPGPSRSPRTWPAAAPTSCSAATRRGWPARCSTSAASTRPRSTGTRTTEALAEAKAICDEDHERVVAAGGLHIIGTERHESRRIDNQLRGRAGRQGDPGIVALLPVARRRPHEAVRLDRVAGLMERMGLEDDVAIESRLVSKTIESAQSRVEGFNFDIRKRVVEFDDVINKQRETIYAERDKVLRNEDLGETIVGFLDDEIDALLDQFAGGEHRRRLEHGGPRRRRSGRWASTGPGTSEDELWEVGGREALREHLHELVDAKLAEKEQEVGEADWTMIERLVLLRTIDSLWVEHLTELDDMRRGIGLRGYAQQDPLNEFRREAFALYDRAPRPHPPPARERRSSGSRSPASRHRRPTTLPMPDPSTLAALRDGSADGTNGDGRAARRAGARASAAGGAAAGRLARARSPAACPPARAPRACGSRSATRSSAGEPAPDRPAGSGPGTRRPGSGSVGTTPASAAPA